MQGLVSNQSPHERGASAFQSTVPCSSLHCNQLKTQKMPPTARDRAIRAFISGGLVIGLGYITMRATAKTDKEIYDSLAPDLKRKVDLRRTAEARKAAHEAQMQKARQADSAEEPQWAQEERGRRRAV